MFLFEKENKKREKEENNTHTHTHTHTHTSKTKTRNSFYRKQTHVANEHENTRPDLGALQAFQSSP